MVPPTNNISLLLSDDKAVSYRNIYTGKCQQLGLYSYKKHHYTALPTTRMSETENGPTDNIPFLHWQQGCQLQEMLDPNREMPPGDIFLHFDFGICKCSLINNLNCIG